MATTTAIKCVSQVNNGETCQEIYETASRGAGRRAKVLRAKGYVVNVTGMGPQWGTGNLTVVDIRPGTNRDTSDLPTVE